MRTDKDRVFMKLRKRLLSPAVLDSPRLAASDVARV